MLKEVSLYDQPFTLRSLHGKVWFAPAVVAALTFVTFIPALQGERQ
jgi:hypothetical protein